MHQIGVNIIRSDLGHLNNQGIQYFSRNIFVVDIVQELQ